MASITSTGAASGMDFESIIQSTINVKQAQLQRKTSQQKEAYTLQLSGLGSLKHELSDFESAMQALAQPENFNLQKFESDQPQNHPFFSVTPLKDAASCSFDVVVKQTATTQKVLLPFDKNAIFGKGILHFHLGRDKNTGELKYLSASDQNLVHFDVKINGGLGHYWSLDNVRDAINRNDFGVSATILRDERYDYLIIDTGMTGVAPTLCSSAPDESAHMWIQAEEDISASGGYYSHLTRLAVNPWAISPNGSPSGKVGDGYHEHISGTDAIITVNGIELVSHTNTFQQISGLDLEVHRVSEKDEQGKFISNTLVLSPDYATITKQVKDFVASYNKLITLIRTLTRHHTYEQGRSRKDGGKLAGDSQLQHLQRRLQNTMSSFSLSSDNKGSVDELYSMGFSLDKHGVLSVDSSTFEKALRQKKPTIVKLFTQEGDPHQENSQGLIPKLRSLVKEYTAPQGLLAQKEDRLHQELRYIDQKEAENNSYLDQYAQDLKKKYSVLDTIIGNAQDTMAYMQSLFDNMVKQQVATKIEALKKKVKESSKPGIIIMTGLGPMLLQR